jgi:hypothetical protein
MAYNPPERPKQTPIQDLFHSNNLSVPFNSDREGLNKFKKWEKDKKAYDDEYKARKARARAKALENKAKLDKAKSDRAKAKLKPKPSTPPSAPGVVPKSTQGYPVRRSGTETTYGR